MRFYKISKLIFMKINKITFFTLINLCFILGSYAQTFPVTEKVVGKNLKTNKDIIAKEYTFSNYIYKYYIDTISNSISIQTRELNKTKERFKNEGNIYVCNLDSLILKWFNEVDYSKSVISYYNDLILHKSIKNTASLNKETGKNQWVIENNIFYKNAKSKIGFGYNINPYSGNTQVLEGVDLNNGKPKWYRKIEKNYGINKIYDINDTTVLIVADGLHLLNLKNGKGWDYMAVTGSKDYSSSIAAGAAGIALGVLTGTYLVPTGGADLITDIISNVIIDDSSNYYFASRHKLVKISKDGIAKWVAVLPEKQTSKSKIILQDSVITIINLGIAYSGYKAVQYGVPYIAKFNKNNGNQIYFNEINEFDYINTEFINDSVLYLTSDYNISKYSNNSGKKLLKETYNNEQFGKLDFFINNDIYVLKDSISFQTLISTDSAKTKIATENGYIIEFDKNLKITRSWDPNQYYVYYYSYNNYKILLNKNKSVIIDSNNIKICELNDITNNIQLLKNKLYDTKDNKLVIIDLNF